MITGDGAYIKKINRGLILSKIIEQGVVSRAELSKITGLNKATISVQVADLLSEKLIYETQLEHNVVGRRPIMLSINPSAGYVLGIDLDYKHIQYIVSDLGGQPVYTHSIQLETDDYDDIVALLKKHIKEFQKNWANEDYGLINVMIGVHGTVNNDGLIYFVPKYQWHNKDIKADLAEAIDIEINIENNANLSAYAERVYYHHHSSHLLAIKLSSGIGTGIMIDGEIHKGFNGFAGEMGHMIVFPDGKPCKCGNNGCWELYASELCQLEELAYKLDQPDLTIIDVQQLIAEEDPLTLKQMKLFIHDLSIGLNNIINSYNPETLVINSDLLTAFPSAIDEIKSNLVSTVSSYNKLVLSQIGKKGSAMGACALSIQRFLHVPHLFLQPSDE